MDANRAGLAQGLFLTSGVPGRAVRATDRMLATLDVLRRREGFGGYVHIKLLPGAEPAQVDEAARLALLPKLERAGRLVRDARHAADTAAPRAPAP